MKIKNHPRSENGLYYFNSIIITSHHSPPESDNDKNDKNNDCAIHLFVFNGTNV